MFSIQPPASLSALRERGYRKLGAEFVKEFDAMGERFAAPQTEAGGR